MCEIDDKNRIEERFISSHAFHRTTGGRVEKSPRESNSNHEPSSIWSGDSRTILASSLQQSTSTTPWADHPKSEYLHRNWRPSRQTASRKQRLQAVRKHLGASFSKGRDPEMTELTSVADHTSSRKWTPWPAGRAREADQRAEGKKMKLGAHNPSEKSSESKPRTESRESEI
jgi:hypothetical protein